MTEPELVELTVKTQPSENVRLDELKRMKRILNERGYDSTYGMIQLAYEWFSQETYGIEWYSIEGIPDNQRLDDFVFKGLTRYLRPYRRNKE